MEAFLGIDVGTTNIKACLFGVNKGLIAYATQPTPVEHDPHLGEGHSPEKIWQTTVRVIQECMARAETKILERIYVRSLAVASMGEEAVCLDSNFRPVGPILTWYDSRPSESLSEIARRIPIKQLRRLTGLPLDSSFTLAKFLWLSEHHRDIFSKAKYWLPVSDYINFRLTGKLGINPSLASRTMMYCPFTNEWLDDMIKDFGLSTLHFPTIIKGGTPVGIITNEAAKVTGLPSDTVVGIGGHDTPCASLAAGITKAGVGLISSGTAEGVFIPVDAVEDIDSSSSLCIGRHCIGETLYLSDFVPTGAIIRWVIQKSSNSPLGTKDEFHSIIEKSILKLEEGTPSCRFTYRRDPISLHSFEYSDLTVTTQPEDMINAALIVLTNDLSNLVDNIERISNQVIREFITCGGLSEVPSYVQWRQRFFRQRLIPHRYPELTSAGAAVLASVASGYFKGYEEVNKQLLVQEE
jgi:sugar (pentulose or hexulose) kinase